MKPNIPTPFEQRSIIIHLCEAVQNYFRDVKHQEDFKKWYLEKYGVPYEFKTKEVKNIGKA